MGSKNNLIYTIIVFLIFTAVYRGAGDSSIRFFICGWPVGPQPASHGRFSSQALSQGAEEDEEEAEKETQERDGDEDEDEQLANRNHSGSSHL